MSYYKQMRRAERALERAIAFANATAGNLIEAARTVDAPKDTSEAEFRSGFIEEANDIARAAKDLHAELADYLGRERP